MKAAEEAAGTEPPVQEDGKKEKNDGKKENKKGGK